MLNVSVRRAVLCLSLFSGIACHKPASPETPIATSSPAQYEALTTFPEPGPPRIVERGVTVRRVALPHDQHTDAIWIYLPTERSAKPLPSVFIVQAGVPPFIGNGFGDALERERHPEHLPYVHAGYAVIAYDLDGQLRDRDNATYEEVEAAAKAFKDADAGMLNARHAIDYVVRMLPEIDANRLYSAGHSSAGRIALLLASSDPRIRGCAAYAAVTDAEGRADTIAAEPTRYLESRIGGFREFLRDTSPAHRVDRLHCPIFVYHSNDDSLIPVDDTVQFVDALKKAGVNVTFVRGTSGDHYDSMIDEGLPKGIAWLNEISGLKSTK